MRGKTVLIIESNEKIIRQLSEPLRNVGFFVTVVQWAEEGLTVIQKGGVDAVVVGKKLPGMTGLEFINELRHQHRYKIRPIVILYGKNELETKIQAFKAGVDDYMVLPFPMQELVMRLSVRLQKTKGGDTQAQGKIKETQTYEIVVPDSFPERGSLQSRSLPSIIGTIHLRNTTGVLRLVQKNKLRALFFQNGQLRGAKLTNKSENLYKCLLKWGVLKKPVNKRVKALSDVGSDKEMIEFVSKSTGLSAERLNGLAGRFLQFAIQKSLKMAKADYDWVETEAAEDMFLVDEPGLHPAHLMIHALRSYMFPPQYKLFMTKLNQWVTPSPHLGNLQEAFRLTGPEALLFSLIAKGKRLGEFLAEGRQIVPYAEQLIYYALCFKAINVGDKRPVSKEEAAVVAHWGKKKKGESRKEIIAPDDIIDGDIEEPEEEPSREPKPAAEPAAPGPAAKAVPESRKKPPEARKKAPRKPAPEQSAPKPHPKPKPKRMSKPQSKPKPPERKPKEAEKPRRKVRELYPVEPSDEIEIPETAGIQVFGFKKNIFNAGDIADIPFPFLFSSCMEFKRTGVLAIEVGKYTTKLFWSRGRLLFARSDDPKLRVDQIMVDMGMITPEQKSQVDEMIAEMGKMRSGTLIFKKQIVNMLQLSEAIYRQIDLILESLFNLTSGAFTFEEGQPSEEEHIPMDLSAEKLLIKGLREMKHLDAVLEFQPDINDTLVQTQRSKQLISQMKLGSVVTAILDKFRHPAKVKEALAGSEIGNKEFKQILIGLMLLGLLNYYLPSKRKRNES